MTDAPLPTLRALAAQTCDTAAAERAPEVTVTDAPVRRNARSAEARLPEP